MNHLSPDPHLSTPRHLEVAIIGGGQAGLTLSWHLKARGIDHLVFEKKTAMPARTMLQATDPLILYNIVSSTGSR